MYVVVDTEVGGGFPYHKNTTPLETLQQAMDLRKGIVQAYAKDQEVSLERADWGLEGLFVYEILPPGSTFTPSSILANGEYEPMYAVLQGPRKQITQIADSIDQLQYMWAEKRGRVHPIKEIANRLDGTIQWSYDTQEPK